MQRDAQLGTVGPQQLGTPHGLSITCILSTAPHLQTNRPHHPSWHRLLLLVLCSACSTHLISFRNFLAITKWHWHTDTAQYSDLHYWPRWISQETPNEQQLLPEVHMGICYHVKKNVGTSWVLTAALSLHIFTAVLTNTTSGQTASIPSDIQTAHFPMDRACPNSK
jgi:hypothetical protein